MRGSMVIRLRPCMNIEYPPPPPLRFLERTVDLLGALEGILREVDYDTDALSAFAA